MRIRVVAEFMASVDEVPSECGESFNRASGDKECRAHAPRAESGQQCLCCRRRRAVVERQCHDRISRLDLRHQAPEELPGPRLIEAPCGSEPAEQEYRHEAGEKYATRSGHSRCGYADFTPKLTCGRILQSRRRRASANRPSAAAHVGRGDDSELTIPRLYAATDRGSAEWTFPRLRQNRLRTLGTRAPAIW